MEEPYSKREQDHFFSELFKRLDKQDRVLERIEGQTTKTNGRVSTLEDWSKDAKVLIESLIKISDDYKRSKTRMYTALTLLVFFGGTIATLSLIAAKSFIHDEVNKGFATIEKSYNIQVDNNP